MFHRKKRLSSRVAVTRAPSRSHAGVPTVRLLTNWRAQLALEMVLALRAGPAAGDGAVRVQTVTIPAVLVHCHSVKIALANGCGRITLKERNVPVPASNKMTAASTISLYVHRVPIMASLLS